MKVFLTHLPNLFLMNGAGLLVWLCLAFFGEQSYEFPGQISITDYIILIDIAVLTVLAPLYALVAFVKVLELYNKKQYNSSLVAAMHSVVALLWTVVVGWYLLFLLEMMTDVPQWTSGMSMISYFLGWFVAFPLFIMYVIFILYLIYRDRSPK